MFFAHNLTPHNAYMPQHNSIHIRILHAVPNAPAVDVYANGIPLARNLNYRGFTEYRALKAGTYQFEVFPAGRRDTPLIVTTATLPDLTIYTIAVAGQLPNISLLPIAEPKIPIPQGTAMLRFSHLAPTTPNVDVILPDGTVLFSDVRFKETTHYIIAPSQTYNIRLRVAGTNDVILEVPNIHILPDRFYTIYAIGLINSQPGLQVLIPLDGNTYINP
jgi:hypothetical protein